MGVRTFEANDGPSAVELIERHAIHLAVVDTRLPAINGMNVLQLVQRLREQHERASSKPEPPTPAAPGIGGFSFQMHVEEKNQEGQTQRRIEVRFDACPAKPANGPVVILIAPPPPQQDPQLLQEALKFNAFSVLSEPVDVNLALDVMARALRRFHQNQWPV
jgi:CheY-like chemotaxis protein